MNLLLDTHAFLWFIAGSDDLTAKARELIEDPENRPFLSAASLWEMAIKISLGKLRLALPFEELVPEQMMLNGVHFLPIEMGHLVPIVSLAFHHRDPFDRLLIAQAMIEQMPIVTGDPAFEPYPVQKLW